MSAGEAIGRLKRWLFPTLPVYDLTPYGCSDDPMPWPGPQPSIGGHQCGSCGICHRAYVRAYPRVGLIRQEMKRRDGAHRVLIRVSRREPTKHSHDEAISAHLRLDQNRVLRQFDADLEAALLLTS